jgi:hypothetical protein
MSILKPLNPGLKLLLPALALAATVLLLLPKKTNAGPAARSAVLVELFTSEGCSSCPPADALLGRLRQDLGSQGVDVIPLGFHVDYWNSLGWKDRFSSPEFSHRQERYAQALRLDGPYTPQMIVDGAAEFVGNDAARARSAIVDAAGHSQSAQIEISAAADKLNVLDVHVKASNAQKGADVLLAITEDNLATKVGAGENSGRELRHAAVVRKLQNLGAIQNGAFNSEVPLTLEKEWKPADLRAVVFVQRGEAGEVLGAASVPLHAQGGHQQAGFWVVGAEQR